MDQKQQILHHYRVDEDSLREISRKVGVDRKAVRHLIQAFEDRLTKDPDLGMEEFLAERPKYKKRDYCPRALTQEITKEIDKWLKENERRRSMGMRKQCLKRQDTLAFMESHRNFFRQVHDAPYVMVYDNM